jgi:hypothetical protein
LTLLLSVIEITQPCNEIADHGIGPHPCWESCEIRKRLVGVTVIARVSNEAVDPKSIGEIGLYGHSGKAFLRDQTLCYC